MAEKITQLTKDDNQPEDKANIPIAKEKKEEKLPANVLKTNITDEMKSAYLDYAMSVIVSRALPDVRDGLKPVQRRIIYAMQDQNMTADKKFYKCAAVIGEVLKKYHPHGDTSVYEALVRMGQDFSLRYPLIWAQGNFGSIDGDPPAAMRYTECRLQKISEELYPDIDKDTVDFVLNDLQNYEPIYLPSLLPNLLINGVGGIAVGMATNIPPHNLSEIIDGINLLIEEADNIGTAPATKNDEKKIDIFEGKMGSFTVKVANTNFESEATVEDLIQYVQGPDFPTRGTIYDQKEFMQMYATGKGRVVMRAKMEVEEAKSGRIRLIVTELPYQVNKATLVAKIAHLIKNKKIEGVADLRDESNKQGIRVVVELKRDAIVKKVQNRLFKYTPLQSTFNGNFVALLNNEPKLMTLKTILEEFIKHRQQIVVRRALFLLKRAKEREHILQGLKIAIDNIDAVIKLIRGSKDVETARKGLIEKFKFTEIQTQAILDMQLRRLAALERQKIEEELKNIVTTIEGFKGLVASPQEIISTVQKELKDIKEKYGDKRKTKIIKGKLGDLSDEDLIADEKCIVSISNGGYIKRLKETTYKKQGRGGKGVRGTLLKEEDVVATIKTCNTHDWAFFFTNTGKVYKMRIWEIPETTKSSKGTPLVNFLSIKQGERMQAFLTISTETLDKGDGFVFFVTEKGRVKKTSLGDFANIRSSGILAIRLSDGDSLTFAGLTTGKDDILITTSQGQSIRFSEKDVRSMGRTAAGVTGITLKKEGDSVVGTVILDEESKKYNLFVVSERGCGKKTRTNKYKVQRRGGSGILTYKTTEKTGKLVSARILNGVATSDILIATASGKVIRLSKNQIPVLGRATQGVRLIRLGSGDIVTSVALLEKEEQILETNEKT